MFFRTEFASSLLSSLMPHKSPTNGKETGRKPGLFLAGTLPQVLRQTDY